MEALMNQKGLDPEGSSFVDSSSTNVSKEVSSLILNELLFPLLCNCSAFRCVAGAGLKVAELAKEARTLGFDDGYRESSP